MNIKFEPYNKITLRNCMYHDSVDEFASSMTLALSREAGGRLGHLLWAHGILFRHAPFIPTDSLTKEYVVGHLLIDNVEFASMPIFRSEIQHNQFTITVLDVSKNYILGSLARWISDNFEDLKNSFTSFGHSKKTKKRIR